MSQEIGSIHYDLDLDDSKFKSKLDSASNSLKETGKNIKDFGANLTARVTLPIAALGGFAIKAASDLTESMNKVDVAFKDSAEEVKKFAETSLTTSGIAQGTALDMAALFGDMGTGMGLTTKMAASQSRQLVELAGDLASFKNISTEIAANALKGVYTGETESLKQLGIIMNDATLEAYALEKGMTKTWKEMNAAEKATTRYAFVMSSTKNAQGDFARTSDGAANQMRIFQESMKELATGFGAILLPTFTAIITQVNELVRNFGALDEGTKKVIVIVALVVAAIGPLILIIGNLVTAIGVILPVMGVVVAALSSPIAIIALLVAGFIALGIKLGWFSDLVQKLSVFVQPLIDQFWIMVHQVQEQLFQAFEQLEPSFEQLTEAFKKSEPLFKLIGVIIGVTLYTAFQVLMLAINVLASVVSAVVPRVAEMFTAAVNIIVGLIEFVVALFQGDWKKAWESLITIGENVRIFISGFVLVVLDLIKGLVTGIVNYFMGLYNSLVGHSIIPDIVNGIIGWFSQIGSGVANALKGVYEAIVEPFMRAYKKVSEIASKVKSSLEKISPFHKSSPSLVEYVEMGAGKITAMYDDMFSKINTSSIDTRSNMVDTFGRAVGQADGGGVTINFNPTGIVARSRQEWRSIMADGIESINEELRARGIDEIGGGYVQGLSTIK